MLFFLSISVVSKVHRPDVRNMHIVKAGYSDTWKESLPGQIVGFSQESESSSFDDDKLSSLVNDVASDAKVPVARISDFFGRMGSREQGTKVFSGFEVKSDPADHLQQKAAVILSQVSVTKNGSKWHVEVHVKYYIGTVRAEVGTFHHHGHGTQVSIPATSLTGRSLSSYEIEHIKMAIYNHFNIQ